VAVTIPLTQGFAAVVDDEEGHLAAHKWCVEGSKKGHVYAVRSVKCADGKRRNIRLHRVILGLELTDKRVGDHIDGNTMNNRRQNLRAATNQQNLRNVVGGQVSGSTGLLGVSRRGSRFMAHIMVDSVQKCLGTYSTPEDANHARLVAELSLFGISPRRADAFREAGLT
jgi:hypothetical protein